MNFIIRFREQWKDLNVWKQYQYLIACKQISSNLS